MRPRGDSCKLFPAVRVLFVAVLVLMLSGWTTCAVFFGFNSCPGAVPQPQITSLSPDSISVDVPSVLLTVNGSNFVPQSKVLWNGTAMATTVVDSHHLQVAITQMTLESLGSEKQCSDFRNVSCVHPCCGLSEWRGFGRACTSYQLKMLGIPALDRSFRAPTMQCMLSGERLISQF